MKRNKNKILLAILALPLLLITACDDVENNNLVKENHFGIFSHNGVYLTQRAKKDVSLSEAKSLIKSNYINNKNVRSLAREVDEEDDKTIKEILSRFGSLTATVKYYLDETDAEQYREDLFQGTDFLSLLQDNNYIPFGQMNAKYIFINSHILDEMDAENREFANDANNLICPFSSRYTYHANEYDELVVQTHHFAELPSSVNGGIGSAFRQDCEIQYDGGGKIVHWQSSLGLYTSTPTGTIKEGYIFEADFTWSLK